MPKKILIVEDDEDSRLGMAVRLRGAGFEPIVAVDGATAIMVAKRENPAVVILDLGLPGGDGFQVLQRLKELGPTANIPVIILSARDPATSRQKAMDLGAAAFLQKPADNVELLAAIRKELGDTNEVTDVRSISNRKTQKRVLLVEDDLDSRQGLSLRLRANGYYILTAADALGALSTALKEPPDLILLDLGLPGGGGRMVLERLKKNPRLAHIPVIILTGSVSETKEPPKGISGYFTKPVDHEALLNAMHEVLN